MQFLVSKNALLIIFLLGILFMEKSISNTFKEVHQSEYLAYAKIIKDIHDEVEKFKVQIHYATEEDELNELQKKLARFETHYFDSSELLIQLRHTENSYKGIVIENLEYSISQMNDDLFEIKSTAINNMHLYYN
mgnify:CR=1 FL=1|tara:strand:+ start:46989 stop:47390 length:402 start_codon:yes stop_codon:yes gene_type:complete